MPSHRTYTLTRLCQQYAPKFMHNRFTARYKWYLVVNIAAASILIILQLYNSVSLSYLVSLTREQYNWMDVNQFMCQNYSVNPKCTKCSSGVPCEYNDEKNFRVIVLAYDRADSLKKCLTRLKYLHMDGDSLGIEIWLDVNKHGMLHLPTYRTANAFASEFTSAQVCVHIQNAHAFIANQWINTYRPRKNSKEISLIIEDDVDVSKYAYKWLKNVNATFGGSKDVYGYSLQMENVHSQSVSVYNRHEIKAPESESIFLHVIFGTWGFSPKPNFWRNFQDWYIRMRQQNSLKPYLENYKATTWYKSFEKRGTQESMAHEMWIIYYVLNHKRKIYCLYSNLIALTGKENVLLSAHRAEKGLHFHGGEAQNKTKLLLDSWSSDYAKFPSEPFAFDSFGNKIMHIND